MANSGWGKWDDASSESDDFDDPDEPIMEGSDNEFSDLEDTGDYYVTGMDKLHDDTSRPAQPDSEAFDSDSDSDSDMHTAAAVSEPRWTTTLTANTINPFTSTVGPAVAISKLPMEVFELFFTSDLLDIIVKETNDYAKLVMEDEKFGKCMQVDVPELKALLGFKILTAINNLPSIVD